MSPVNRMNCTTKGSFSPSSSRSLSWSSTDVSTPVIWLIGSPTKRNREKARNATASITKMDWTSRFSMNLAISPSRHLASTARSVHFDPAQHEEVVRALYDVDIFLHRPDQRLSIQGNVGHIVLKDTGDLFQHVLTGLRVDFLLDWRQHVVDLWIGVSAKVPGSQTLCRGMC